MLNKTNSFKFRQANSGANQVEENPNIVLNNADSRNEEIEAQRIAFQKENPDFDMAAELENPQFVNYIWANGLSVEDAFFLVHREELLEQARLDAMEELAQRQERIPENGAAKNRPAIAKKNPKDLTGKEIESIIERARKGEKITF
ncbi:MAG: hypothetical protein IJD36_03355 [Clostridia bacterium]|nr:hypothetical protein [Clostridia bacterium]